MVEQFGPVLSALTTIMMPAGRSPFFDSCSEVSTGPIKAEPRGRKPGRFKTMHQVVHSDELPPPVVAYYNQVLDQATLQRFQQGLLNASKSDRGQTLLTLFRLTEFAKVPGDYSRMPPALSGMLRL